MRGDLDSPQQAPNSCRGDVHAIGFAVLHNFCVPPGDGDSRLFRGSGHGANFRFQNLRGQSSFKNESDDNRFCPRAGHRKVIHGAVNGQFSDGATRKTQRLDHKTIGGHGDACAVDLDVGGIAQRRLGIGEEDGSKQTFHESSARLAAGAMRHFNLRLAEPDLGSKGSH